jgi:hypothetical protein
MPDALCPFMSNKRRGGAISNQNDKSGRTRSGCFSGAVCSERHQFEPIYSAPGTRLLLLTNFQPILNFDLLMIGLALSFPANTFAGQSVNF